MWKEFTNTLEHNCEFRPPAASSDIESAEKALKISLPQSLREFLLETNGLYSAHMHLKVIWSTDEIVRRNKLIREDAKMATFCMAFDSLLFFADAGVDGVLFAFPISATGVVQERRVIVWYPIEDSRPVLAYGLKDYLKRWLTGSLQI